MNINSYKTLQLVLEAVNLSDQTHPLVLFWGLSDWKMIVIVCNCAQFQVPDRGYHPGRTAAEC